MLKLQHLKQLFFAYYKIPINFFISDESQTESLRLSQNKLTFYFHRREIQTALPFALCVSTPQHGGVATLKMTAEGAFVKL